MNRLLRLILLIALLITCSGCFIPGHGWLVPGDELPGEHDGGGHGDHDGGGHGDHDGGGRGDGGGHGDKDKGKHK